MTDKDILQEAIKKANKNGFNFHYLTEGELAESIVFHWLDDNNYYSIIFNHDFAEAFFGKDFNTITGLKKYEYHLQRMVLEEDPLKYIEKFL